MASIRESLKRKEERQTWNKTHTGEAIKIITEWLVSCKVREMVNLCPWQRDTLEWMLKEMGFDIHTIVWDIFCQEMRPTLELVGGSEKVLSNDWHERSRCLEWTVLDRTEKFWLEFRPVSLGEYHNIERCQEFLSGFRFLKSKDKEMWEAQRKLFLLKARLKESYWDGWNACYMVMNIGRQVALLKLPEYQIVGWFNYSLEGIEAMQSVIEARSSLR